MFRRKFDAHNLFAAAGLIFSVGALCASGQTPAPDSKPASRAIPRTAGGKPDFTGYWNIPYVPNMALGHEDAVPYTETGRAAYINHDSKDDPTSNCWFPGVPRIMQSPYPSQWVQTPTHLVILFEYMHMFRSIPLDGRPHPNKMEPAFMGDSTGHWEGDTLVIDTAGLKGPPWTWLDTAGHQHSEALHVIERLQRTPDGISYEFTVDDPIMYSQPWTLQRTLTPLKMTPGLPELIEYNCDENNRDLKHLISTKPAQDPPAR
jgi:hypothetical protein